MQNKSALISIAIPVYNEASGIAVFHKKLKEVLESIKPHTYEIIYCDDGSTDDTRNIIKELCDEQTKLVALSRNFGKEYALAAAIKYTTGQAVVLLDADGQHPVNAIPLFVKSWQEGAEVVIGRRSLRDSESIQKRWLSKAFYFLLNKASSVKTNPLDTDFRLLDRVVADEFLKLSETDRLTRGLIDWLGFSRATVNIEREERIAGNASYSTKKLIKLSIDSLVSLSSRPLYFLSLVGGLIAVGAGILGTAVLVEQIILKDPLQWKFTGTAMLGILTVFLVGIVILAQGVASLYTATVYNQVKRRPLYIVDNKKSMGIDKDESVL